MERVVDLNEEYHAYLRDESRSMGYAESISFPKTETEVSLILSEMYKKGICVTIQGARTGISGGAVPNGGHILNLSKMDQVVGIRKSDNGFYALSLQPGVILSNLRESISKRLFDISKWDKDSREVYYEYCKDEEYFFAPDPTEASATLGGMLACNASGARSFRYGSMRNHVTSIRVVLSNGETLQIDRGRQVALENCITLKTEQGSIIQLSIPKYEMPKTKNTSGYYVEEKMDAIDLFIGSDGTLGVVTEIEVSLLPMPKHIWGISSFFYENDAAIDFVVKARKEIKGIASIEYFDGKALEILREQKKTNPGFARLPDIKEGLSSAVYIELHCQNEENILASTFKIQDTMELYGASGNDTWVARNDTERNMLYFFRHAVPESVNMLIDDLRKNNPKLSKLGTDMAVPDHCLKDMMGYYTKMLEETSLQSAIWGHIGDNHLHVNIIPRSESEYLKGKELYRYWAEIVTDFKGAISAEHGVGKLKKDLLSLMYGQEHLHEMMIMKKQLDPKCILGIGTLFDMEKKVE